MKTPSTSAPAIASDPAALAGMIRRDGSVSTGIREDLTPCAGDGYPMDTDSGNLTAGDGPDLVVNITTCGDGLGIAAYVYRMIGGKYQDVFADERPPVYGSVADGRLQIMHDVYRDNDDPVTYPTGEEAVSYAWRGEPLRGGRPHLLRLQREDAHRLPRADLHPPAAGAQVRAHRPRTADHPAAGRRAHERRRRQPRAPGQPPGPAPSPSRRAPPARPRRRAADSPMPATHVLFVEDDDVIREATTLALERDGFQVTAAPDGLAGLTAFRARRPDLALLDVMVPGLDGVSLCRRIRDESTVPVIMVSARADAIDVVLGLEAGADDYVTKPFDGAVLVARIRAVLRRFRATAPTTSRTAAPRCPSATSRSTPRAWRSPAAGELLALTPTEMRLLLEFAGAPGTVLSRDRLLERVWDYEWGGDTRVVDVHVQRLRAKIGQDRLETVRGFGYKLRA